MLKRTLPVTLALLSAATYACWAGAQTEITTHIIDQKVVEKLATSLNHTSMVELPGPVTAAVIGTEDVRMEYRDNVVILEPGKAGVKTNLMVWIGDQRLVYEVMPASETSQFPYVIREEFDTPAPAAAAPGPSPEEARAVRDSSLDPFLLSMRNITACEDTFKSKGVHVKVDQVGEDHFSYYVRLTAVNRTKHPYRIVTPMVYHLNPEFGAKTFLRAVDEQIPDKQFDFVKFYDSEAVSSHGSTLPTRDLKPGESVSWAMAVNKIGKPIAMYEFRFPADGPERVHAVVIF